MGLDEEAREVTGDRAETEAKLRADGADLVQRLKEAGVASVSLLVRRGEPVKGWVLETDLSHQLLATGPPGVVLTRDGLLHQYQIAGNQRLLDEPVAFSEARYHELLVAAAAALLGGTFSHADEATFATEAQSTRRWMVARLVFGALIAGLLIFVLIYARR